MAKKAPSNPVKGAGFVFDRWLAGRMRRKNKRELGELSKALTEGSKNQTAIIPATTGVTEIAAVNDVPGETGAEEGQYAIDPTLAGINPESGSLYGRDVSLRKLLENNPDNYAAQQALLDNSGQLSNRNANLQLQQMNNQNKLSTLNEDRAYKKSIVNEKRAFQKNQAEILAGGKKAAADLLFERTGITAGTRTAAEIEKARQLFLRTPKKGADGFMYYPADPDVLNSKPRRANPDARNLKLEKFDENKKLIEQLTGPAPAPEQSSSLNAIPGGPPLRQLVNSSIDLDRYEPFEMDDRNNVTLYQDKTTGDIIPAGQMPDVTAPTLAGSTTSTAKKPTLRQLFQSFPYEIREGILQSGDVKKGISKYLLRQKSGFEITTNKDGGFTITQGDNSKRGLTKTVRSSTQKNILEGQSRVDAQNYVSSLYRPEFLTYGGEIKSGIMTKLNKLTPSLRDSFTKARAAFLSQTNQAFIAYRKWATGVAGGKEEMSEIKRATFSENDSPQNFEAKLQAVKFMTRKLLARQQMALRQGVTPENDAQGNPIGKKWKDFVKLNPISDVPTLQKRGVELEGLGYSKDKIKTILRHEYGLTQ